MLSAFTTSLATWRCCTRKEGKNKSGWRGANIGRAEGIWGGDVGKGDKQFSEELTAFRPARSKHKRKLQLPATSFSSSDESGMPLLIWQPWAALACTAS